MDNSITKAYMIVLIRKLAGNSEEVNENIHTKYGENHSRKISESEIKFVQIINRLCKLKYLVYTYPRNCTHLIHCNNNGKGVDH